MSSKKSVLREWFEAFFFAIFLILILRVFVVEAFTIPTTSMEKTLQVGDFIMVSKVHFGPRVPITPLTFPFSHQTIPFSTDKKAYIDKVKIPYYRLPGFSSIKRNDVIIFNYPLEAEYPVDHRTYYVKRCIGLPGDTIIIYDGNVLYNNDTLKSPEGLQINYHVKTDPSKFNKEIFYEYEINDGGKISNQGDYRVPLTESTAKLLKKEEQVYNISPWKEKGPDDYQYLFPGTKDYRWSIDSYGPLIIPKKGDSVLLIKFNLPLYQRIIENYESNKLEERNDSIFINGAHINYYTFKMNYYFMLGDNRHYSSDSRFWGFVPEDHIMGKAWFVLFSVNKNNSGFNKIRWNRCFRLIR